MEKKTHNDHNYCKIFPRKLAMTDQNKPYWVLAFYKFTSIENPQQEVARQKKYLKELDSSGRIYISEQGINAQCCLLGSDAQKYIDWLKSDERYADVLVKVQYWHEHCFPRLTVKYREQLAALDKPFDINNTGTHLSPEDWKKMLDQAEERGEKPLLLDVRNQYEYELGHFEGSVAPNCKTFREYNNFFEKVREEHGEDTPVMMCCTGGIRCEIYSSLMKDHGFKNIYQLDGGIINYGEKVGAKHWKGKLFVFDDRMSVPISEKEQAPVIAKCHFCNEPSEHYYNCADMDCNHLFIACDACLEEYEGCCGKECMSAPRKRPLEHQTFPKPFRKWYVYAKEKEDLKNLNAPR